MDRLERALVALAAEPDPHTSVSDPAAAAEAHVADSLVALELEPVRAARRIADIGAGAGFPGLALAAALPGTRVDLIEAQRRKCALIGRLAAAAGLDNARPVNARAEDWAAGEGAGAYDLVTARAVAPLAVLGEYAAPLLVAGGTLVCWKGTRDGREEAAGAAAARQLGLAPAEARHVLPFAGAHSRHLHVFRKVAPTPPRFPRRSGVAAKRPLA